jgi:2-keto-4-pentenoate hydratase
MQVPAHALHAPGAAALERLVRARVGRRPCAPVRNLLPAGDLAAAYAVQAAWAAGEVAAGDSVIGRKIGLTSPSVQAQLGVAQPDFGTLLASMAWPQDEPIDMARLLQPRIEAEIAFLLVGDLDKPGISARDVLAATGSVAPALEIVDSRIRDWDISITDTVADNASSGLFTIGRARQATGELELAACQMRMRRGPDEVSAGSGAACLGHPAAAVAWLATAMQSHDQPLRAGQIVLSGALGPMVPVRPGDQFTAEIDGLGQVSATFGTSWPVEAQPRPASRSGAAWQRCSTLRAPPT